MKKHTKELAKSLIELFEATIYITHEQTVDGTDWDYFLFTIPGTQSYFDITNNYGMRYIGVNYKGSKKHGSGTSITDRDKHLSHASELRKDLFKDAMRHVKQHGVAHIDLTRYRTINNELYKGENITVSFYGKKANWGIDGKNIVLKWYSDNPNKQEIKERIESEYTKVENLVISIEK